MDKPRRELKRPTHLAVYTELSSTSEEEQPTQSLQDPETYDPLRSMRDFVATSGIQIEPLSWDKSLKSPGTGNALTAASPLNPVGSCQSQTSTPIRDHSSGGSIFSSTQSPTPGNSSGASVVSPMCSSLENPHYAYASTLNSIVTILERMEKKMDDGEKKSSKVGKQPKFIPFSSVEEIEAFEESSEEDFEDLVSWLLFESGKDKSAASTAADLFRATLNKTTDVMLDITITRVMPAKKTLEKTRYCEALVTTLKSIRKEFEEKSRSQLFGILTAGLKLVKNVKRRK